MVRQATIRLFEPRVRLFCAESGPPSFPPQVMSKLDSSIRNTLATRQSTICWQAKTSCGGGSVFFTVASSLSSFGLKSVFRSCSNHSRPVSRQATTTSVMFRARVKSSSVSPAVRPRSLEMFKKSRYYFWIRKILTAGIKVEKVLR